jgi:hypothetical protein
MLVPMGALAAACIVIGAAAPRLAAVMVPVLVQVSGLPAAQVTASVATAAVPLARIAQVALALAALVALLAGLRRWLLAGRPLGETVTWDCGYAAPSPRMQYTASSFARPLTELFAGLLQTRSHGGAPQGWFPPSTWRTTETPDVCAERLYGPVFSAVERALFSFRWLQHGRVHLYVLYVALTLAALLAWKAR